MSKPKHTPGPWSYRIDSYGDMVIHTEDNIPVAYILEDRHPNYRNNARLIAAAPCLLEAIEAYLEAECPDSVQRAADMMEAAVKRAKGGAE